MTVAATAAAKATHHLGEGVLQVGDLAVELRGPVATLLRDVVDERERFFCALYRVVASVTRWLPCSLGKVSMTRCAGLTSPSAIAAADWMAMSSSMRASSRRLRNSQRVSGSTQWPWAGLT